MADGGGGGDDQWKVDKVHALHTMENHQEVEVCYDDFAVGYDKLVLSLNYCGPANTAKFVSKYEPNRKVRILDVGCGTGLLGEELFKAGYKHLYGVDLSMESLNIVEKKGCYLKAVKANFGPKTPLEFADGYFDVVTSTGSFLPTHLNETCLPEMIRLAKPDGLIIITTRKYIFDGETGDMKLKSGLVKLTKDGALQKVAHEESFYEKDGNENVIGLTLIYKVLK